MNNQYSPLTLENLKEGDHIDVVDRLRRYGIRGKVEEIITNDSEGGEDVVVFSDVKNLTRYRWHAVAMGLTSAVGVFWKTYKRDQGPAGIVFGSLYLHNLSRQSKK